MDTEINGVLRLRFYAAESACQAIHSAANSACSNLPAPDVGGALIAAAHGRARDRSRGVPGILEWVVVCGIRFSKSQAANARATTLSPTKLTS